MPCPSRLYVIRPLNEFTSLQPASYRLECGRFYILARFLDPAARKKSLRSDCPLARSEKQIEKLWQRRHTFFVEFFFT